MFIVNPCAWRNTTVVPPIITKTNQDVQTQKPSRDNEHSIINGNTSKERE